MEYFWLSLIILKACKKSTVIRTKRILTNIFVSLIVELFSPEVSILFTDVGVSARTEPTAEITKNKPSSGEGFTFSTLSEIAHTDSVPVRNIPKFKDRANWSRDTFQPMRRRACVYQQTNQNIAPVLTNFTHVLRTGFWDRQGANIASRCKEMYGVELFLRVKAVFLDRECNILP